METSPFEDRLEIRPEPTPDETAAIAAALARILDEDADGDDPPDTWRIANRSSAVRDHRWQFSTSGENRWQIAARLHR